MAKPLLDHADAERLRQLLLMVFPLQIIDIHKSQTLLIWVTKNTNQNINSFNDGLDECCERLKAPVVPQRGGSMRLEDTKFTVIFPCLLVILINLKTDQSIDQSFHKKLKITI